MEYLVLMEINCLYIEIEYIFIIEICSFNKDKFFIFLFK